MIRDFYLVKISVWVKIEVLRGLKVLRNLSKLFVLASVRVACFHSDEETPANRKETNVNLSDHTSSS